MQNFQGIIFILIRAYKGDLINFYFPWNRQKTVLFLIISGGNRS